MEGPLAGPAGGAVRSFRMPFESRYQSLVDVFERTVEAHRGRPLFGTKQGGGWGWITYGEFANLVECLRGGLAALGVARGDRVAIVSNNRVPWAVAAYACYGLGAVFVPLYEAQAPKDWEFVVRDSGAKILAVANEAVLGKAKYLLDAVPSLGHFVLIDGDAGSDARVTTYVAALASARPLPVVHPDPEEPATILYTSGTTSTPKGVILTHGNLASNVSAAQDVFPILPSDRSLSILPWAHAFGQTCELHTFFACGASMALCEGMDKVLDNLAEVSPTLLACVPTIFNRLYTAVQQQLAGRPKAIRALVSRALAAKGRERAGARLGLAEKAIVAVVDRIVFSKVRQRLGGKLRFAISGGAALSREVAEFIDSIGVTVFEGYGLTETSPVASANGPGARKIGSVGRPFPGVTVTIDPSAVEHPASDRKAGGRVEGEIIVAGPNVMKGYFNRPEETAAVLTPTGAFRTGDMGYLDGEGFLVITGRIKEQYKLENGKYVVPSPLEDDLKLSPYIANVMVYGENRPYNVALVMANVPALRQWAERSHVALPQDANAIFADERVRDLVRSEIKAHSTAFKGFERIEAFELVAGEFTVESGMLTPKMGLKRRRVVEQFGAVIERLYARGKDAPRFAGGQRLRGVRSGAERRGRSSRRREQPPPVDHLDAALGRPKLDRAAHPARVAPDLDRDRARERHPDLLYQPVVHPAERVRPAPEPRRGRDRAEGAAVVRAHVDEARHALGEGKCAEVVSELRARSRRGRPRGCVVEHRATPLALEALRLAVEVEREHFVAEVLDEEVRVARRGRRAGRCARGPPTGSRRPSSRSGARGLCSRGAAAGSPRGSSRPIRSRRSG